MEVRLPARSYVKLIEIEGAAILVWRPAVVAFDAYVAGGTDRDIQRGPIRAEEQRAGSVLPVTGKVVDDHRAVLVDALGIGVAQAPDTGGLGNV